MEESERWRRMREGVGGEGKEKRRRIEEGEKREVLIM